MAKSDQFRLAPSPETWIRLNQFLADLCHEMDGDGANISDFYTEEGVFRAGSGRFEGHAGLRAFYEERRARILASGGKVRTARHVFANLRIAMLDEEHAILLFKMFTYSGAGAPPLNDATNPMAIADSRIECRREADGAWRVVLFSGDVIFLGTDPLIGMMTSPQLLPSD